MSKIFGIGLSRTGTTSLAATMKLLGYSARHYPNGMKEIEEHTFCNDSPISARFEELDQLYPQSKFIYTTRNIEDWVRSCQRHFVRTERLVSIRTSPDFVNFKDWYNYGDLNLYGCASLELATISREQLIASYHTYEKRVYDYFKGREDDLLEICIMDTASLPLTKIVGFLEKHGLIGIRKLNSAANPLLSENRN